MRYSANTGLYAALVAGGLAGCGKDAPIQSKAVSGLESTVLAEQVAHSAGSKAEELDLSTPGKAVEYGRTFIHGGNLKNLQKVMTQSSYQAFCRELENDKNKEATQTSLKNTQFEILGVEYVNDNEAKVAVEYTLPTGKKEREKENAKKIGDKWFYN